MALHDTDNIILQSGGREGGCLYYFIFMFDLALMLIIANSYLDIVAHCHIKMPKPCIGAWQLDTHLTSSVDTEHTSRGIDFFQNGEISFIPSLNWTKKNVTIFYLFLWLDDCFILIPTQTLKGRRTTWSADLFSLFVALKFPFPTGSV